MVFRVFISFFFFWFRSNGKKNIWMNTIFVALMVIISKLPFSKLLDISCFQSSQQLRGPLTTAFERHFTVEDFTDMISIRVNSFMGKYHETKMAEGALEIISCAKIRACSLKNIIPRHFTYYCIILFL